MNLLATTRRRNGRIPATVRFAAWLLCVPVLHAITITTTLPGYYSQNNKIQPVVFQATGASAPIQWSISAGSLPPGLTLTTSGNFSGTPTTGGTYRFTVQAATPQAPGNAPGTKSFVIGIPQITTASPLPPAFLGIPYSIQFQVSDAPAGGVWSVSVGGLPNGLTIDPRSGIYSGTPARAGTYNLMVSVSFATAFAAAQVSLTINPAPQTLTVAPSALQFSVAAGNTSLETLTVSVSGAAVTFTVQIDDGNGGPAPTWLSVSPYGSTTPGILHVRLASTSTLTPGAYRARIRVGLAAIAAVIPPVDIPVTLTVSNPPPQLTAAPPIVRFHDHISNPGIHDRSFILSNAGGGGPIPFSLAVVNKSPWITGLQASDQTIRTGAPVRVRITVNTQGLAVGIQRDVIRVTTPLAPPYDQFDVPVSLFVAAQGPSMSLSQTGVRFATKVGGRNSRTQQIDVRDVGDSSTTVNWTAEAVQGADLVTLTNPQGSSTPGNPASFGISLSSSAASSVGGQFALIQVSDPQSQNAPQYVVVVADVGAAVTAPSPDPDPSGLAFTATVGVAAPAAQQVTVNTTSATAVTFHTSAATDDGANWLSAQSNSTSTSQASPAQVSVSVTPGALSAGTYTGTVSFEIGGIVRGVTVTMLLLPRAVLTAMVVGPMTDHSAGCSPSSIVLAQAGIADNFSVPAGWPATLAVQVGDDCGNALTSASVVASFSNGDPPVTLNGDGQSSTYSATWQPGTPATGITVTIDAVFESLPSAETRIAGRVDTNTQLAPSLVTGGFLNNLFPQVGAPLAPGTVTQVYGDNLADSPALPSSVPLPTTFQNVEALVGGLGAPLFYVSKTQLVVQIPSELAANQSYAALLAVGNQYTLPQEVELAPVTPGTVAFADGNLVAQHADFSLVDANHPAKPGEPLTIYLVGMGATSPPVASGAASPAEPLANVASKTRVTVDGQTADVSFSGLTPGGVGLYQINFTVPPSAKAGGLDVIITEDGVPANATKLIVAP